MRWLSGCPPHCEGSDSASEFESRNQHILIAPLVACVVRRSSAACALALAQTGASSGMLTSIFRSHSGVIVVLGMGVPKRRVAFTLSAEVIKQAGPCMPVVHQALALGVSLNTTAMHYLNADGSMVNAVELGADGEAIIQIPPSC